MIKLIKSRFKENPVAITLMLIMIVVMVVDLVVDLWF